MSIRSVPLQLAADLQTTLVQRVATEGNTWVDQLPRMRARLPDYVAHWLPPTAGFCRRPDSEHCTQDAQSCTMRCSGAYWRGHGGTVSSLMGALAGATASTHGRHVPSNAWIDLHIITGHLHDLDYLAFPHDVPTPPARPGHPFPLAAQLFLDGAPALMALAVLEHSPSVTHWPSTALSHALVACDNVATFASAQVPFEFPPDILRNLPPSLTTVVTTFIRDKSTANKARHEEAVRSLRWLFL